MGTTCHSKLDGAVDGTSCGEDKVSLPFHEHWDCDENVDFVVNNHWCSIYKSLQYLFLQVLCD